MALDVSRPSAVLYLLNTQSKRLFSSVNENGGTHCGLVYMASEILVIIGSSNGLSPGRLQAIIWTNARLLLIWPLGTNFSEIVIEIDIFSFKKMHLKISSGKCRPFCLGLNVLSQCYISVAKKKLHTITPVHTFRENNPAHKRLLHPSQWMFTTHLFNYMYILWQLWLDNILSATSVNDIRKWCR